MDKELASLILECHKPDVIWPYLKLRSIHARDGYVSEKLARETCDDQAVQLMHISGFIRIADGKVLLAHDDGSWLYLPKTPARRPDAKQSNRSFQLERLAKLTGWPVDFEKNRGYYSAHLNRLLKKYSFDEIETSAYDNQGMGLKQLLVTTVFKSLLVKFEAESSA